MRIFGRKKQNTPVEDEEYMTLSDSEHVQFFSKKDIVSIFESRGFKLEDFGGSCMFSGIGINLCPTLRLVTYINNKLGDLFPLLASGYYFLFTNTQNINVKKEKE